MKNLDSLLEKYVALQEQEAAIKAAKDQLKTQFIEAFDELGTTSYTSTSGELKGTLVYKATIKYDDEAAIIKYLEDNGLSTYLKTVIDTTNFNKALKNSKVLQEGLQGKYSSKEVPTFTAKRV